MENKLRAVICDLDGTLCLFEKEDKTKAHYRNPYDASTCENDLLNEVVNGILFHQQTVILVSGREDKYRTQTEKWLRRHDIDYSHLYMRATGDNRKDSVIKKEIYENSIKPFYDIDFILDDRNQVVEMWRSLGLVCLQVADGDF